ncbi:MAG: hypothetical protein LC792_20975 [Actinobacteria bacterium]|nr:hypothetical protein [Actinomycetota bacterium]
MIEHAFTDPDSAMRASGVLVGAGAILSSLEWMALRKELRPDGALPWKLTGSRRFLLEHPALQRLLSRLYEPPYVLVLILARAASAAALVAMAIADVGLLAPFAALGLSTMLLHYRHPYGLDGSDQVTVIISIGLAVGLALGVESLALAFVAAQAVLSYFIAGVSKLGGPVWRDGTAVPAILSTRTYGHPPLGALLVELPLIGRGLTWSTVAFESLFPLALLAPIEVLLAFLVFGAMLHIGTAVTMGLNVFAWSFIATYPCIIWAAHQLG